MQVTIAKQLGLDPSTVSNFFMNARRRSADKWRDEAAEAAGLGNDDGLLHGDGGDTASLDDDGSADAIGEDYEDDEELVDSPGMHHNQNQAFQPQPMQPMQQVQPTTIMTSGGQTLALTRATVVGGGQTVLLAAPSAGPAAVVQQIHAVDLGGHHGVQATGQELEL